MQITESERQQFLEGIKKLKEGFESDRITKMTRELSNLYPMEANYGSRCSLWLCALNDGVVSREEYEGARDYYGRLWTYVGD